MPVLQTHTAKTENTQLLNQVLVVVLWIKLVLSSIWLLMGIYVHITEGWGMPVWEDCLSWALSLVAICGAWLFLKVNRWGFYLLAGTNLVNIIWAVVNYCTLSPDFQETLAVSMSQRLINSLTLNAGQLALLLLLMLLKQKGKNAYQTLWEELQ